MMINPNVQRSDRRGANASIHSRVFHEREERASPVEFCVPLPSPATVALPLVIAPSAVDIARSSSLDGHSPFILSRTIPDIPERHTHTPPRCAILGGVLAHAVDVLHLDRSRASFRCIQTQPRNTWKVSKGTSVRGRGRTRGKRGAQGRAQHANPPDLLRQREPTLLSLPLSQISSRLFDRLLLQMSNLIIIVIVITNALLKRARMYNETTVNNRLIV